MSTVGRENQQRLMDYLRAHPCAACGEDSLIVLEFHHVRGTKIRAVTSLVTNGYAWKVIEDEIAKCVVLCANCHRIHTAGERRNFFRRWDVPAKSSNPSAGE